MSSPNGSAVRLERRTKPAAAAPSREHAADLSADATALAATMERALAKGQFELLTPQALQTLIAASCRTYAARVEGGQDLLPFSKRNAVSPTDVMITASGLLRSVNLAVFELGMWQSWTGR